MEASASLSNIPNHIIQHILLQLPVKFVIRCQCVCKRWRSLIQDDNFKLSYRGQGRLLILTHESRGRNYRNSRFFVRSTGNDLRLQRHKWPFGEGYPLIRESNIYGVKLCYCNGLVLVVAERDLLWWNPSTRCSTKVLEGPYAEPRSVILAGLCFNSCTRDYKAVLLLSRGFGQSLVISASLTHKEWRPVEFPYCSDAIRDGVNFRNTFHWWVISDTKYHQDWDFLPSCDKIIYFDPIRDEFRNLPTPKLRHGQEYLIVGLGVINDYFCMAHEEVNPNKIQVLIMKEYGRQESWMTAFAIQTSEFIDTFGGYDDNSITFYSLKKDAHEILFLSTSGWPRKKVCVYDRKKDELKEVLMDILTSHKYIVSMCFYVESLVCHGHTGLLSQ
ncbi:PREDICTED: putative F-box protein At3g16210 [Ipomoea nil]|uniref:putative F-box protein At3g16210 n=1 Tax=Ipomoea nil TaxID=35883 RepID=UPI000901DB1A|nr:PREDICTED: putative F-box protein At3g16210 [Ipomoea nil]